MKIVFTPDRTSSPQDNYEYERLLITTCYKNISNHKDLRVLLSDWRSFNYNDYFNLNLWIKVLNTLDLAMHEIFDKIYSSHRSNTNYIKDDDIFNDYKTTLETIIIWSTSFIKHSFNTSIYRSAEVFILILSLKLLYLM